MWSEIPWSRMVKWTSGRLWGKTLNLAHVRCTFFLCCKVGWFFTLMCSKWLAEERCPTEHLLSNTPIWVWLLAIIYEIWVIFRYSWKAQEYDLYAPTRGNAFDNLVSVKSLGETHSHKTCNSRHSPLLKLWMGIAWSSRQMFSLTVSAEKHGYIYSSGRRKISILGFWDLVGIVKIYMDKIL
jgi:hypothetical protein